MARCAQCRIITRGPNTDGRRCSRCNGPMLFNASANGYSDLRLVNAMNRLSAEGRLAYTDEQLFYAVSGRKLQRKGLVQSLLRRKGVPPHVVSTSDAGTFQRDLRTWVEAGGQVPGRLLTADDISRDPNRQTHGDGPSPDLTAHGFDRAVVVDSAAVAVMLVANNFHVDHRCAVLSEEGYPEAFRGELLTVLNRNPDLRVAVLHGASPAGLGLIHRIRGWFPDPRINLIEVGLRPAQVTKAKLYTAQGPRPGKPSIEVLDDPNLARLADWERDWLAWGLSTPLATIGPTKLMSVLGKVLSSAARIAEDEVARSGRSSRSDSTGYNDAGLWFWDLGDDDELGDDDQSDDHGFDGADFDGDG